jgi:hypothetical protein
MSTKTAKDEDGSAGDLLWGVRAIAAEINRPERQTSYLLESGQLPAGKSNRLWVASRRKLRAHFDSLTEGRAA